MDIIKASGELVRFDANKLRQSLKRVGVLEEEIERILFRIIPSISEQMPTAKIQQLAFDELRKHSQGAAAKYKLKKALQELGPTGYPFERLVAKLFELESFHCTVGTTLQGQCVSHELDVLARKGKLCRFAECKFRNDNSHKIDIKTTLYVQARMEDLRQGLGKTEAYAHTEIEAWLACNGRFSEDSLQYAKCRSLKLLGWSYPKGQSIRERMDAAKLYPLTCLSSLKQEQKKQLLNKGYVFCRDMLQIEEISKLLQLAPEEAKALQKEIQSLLGS